jgi:hypothetical protein
MERVHGQDKNQGPSGGLRQSLPQELAATQVSPKLLAPTVDDPLPHGMGT